jgi:hypothetical protein
MLYSPLAPLVYISQHEALSNLYKWLRYAPVSRLTEYDVYLTKFDKTNICRFISVCNFLIYFSHERREYVEENNNKVNPQNFKTSLIRKF